MNKKEAIYNLKGQLPSILLFSSLLVAFLLVNLLFRQADFSNTDKLMRYGHSLNDAELLAEAYSRSAREKDELATVAKWLRFHYSDPPPKRWLPGTYTQTDSSLVSYFRGLEDPDLSAYGWANLTLEQGNPTGAMLHLGEARDWEKPYFQSLLGRISESVGDFERAYRYYQNESSLNPTDPYSYLRRYNIAKAYSWTDTLSNLLNEERSAVHLPPLDLRFHYLNNHQPLNYTKALFRNVYNQIALVDLLAAAMVMCAWLFYLVRIDPFTRHNRPVILAIVFAGAVLALLTHLAYDIMELNGFALNGSFANDLGFSILGIGLVEEAIKCVPYLIVWRLGKLKEPFDHLLYICASALGFSFSENLLYYDLANLHLIHARALTAVVAHMCFSSIIAYGLMKRQATAGSVNFKDVLKWLLLAALVHGFYDFWVISDWAQNLQAITIVIYVLATFAWMRMINNALSNASRAANFPAYPVNRIQFYLVASLSLIFAMEYVITGWHFGSRAANANLWDAVLFGGYLIVFLSTNLSDIQIKPGKWARIIPGLQRS